MRPSEVRGLRMNADQSPAQYQSRNTAQRRRPFLRPQLAENMRKGTRSSRRVEK
jgi:hypothetical protein